MSKVIGDRRRCRWCGDDPLYQAYHDYEWGEPIGEDQHLFEMLTLEGAQAGLSWLTILKKRDGYRRAFAGFHAKKVAKFGAKDIQRLLADPGIVRNRLKIESTISNARALLQLQKAEGSFGRWLWAFVDFEPVINHWRSMQDVPPRTELSDTISKALKKRGFRFVGSTIVYALLQAVGVVDDHLRDCWKRRG